MTEETKYESVGKSLQISPIPPTFTPDLYAKLSILAVNRRATRKELQIKLGISKTQVSQAVSKLRQLGFIKRCYETPEDYHIVSIELTPAGEAALRAPAPVRRREISPAVREVFEALKAGEQDQLTPEQLALPLEHAEVRELLSCSTGEPFLETRLNDLIKRGILKPLPSSKKGSGNRFSYSLKSVLDLIEQRNAPKNTIAPELVEVLEVLRTEGRDHLTQNHWELPIDTAGVVVLGMHVTGKPFSQQRIYDLCRRKRNPLQPIGSKRRKGYRLLFRVGDVLNVLENST